MLRPDGAHLFVRGEFSARNLLVGGDKVGLFLGGQLDHRLIVTREFEHEARESREQQAAIEAAQRGSFDAYLAAYLAD